MAKEFKKQKGSDAIMRLIGKKKYAELAKRYEKFVGQAIVDGLIKEQMMPGFPPLGITAKGPDYDQDGGDYEQSTGGSHGQTGGGSYKQSMPKTEESEFMGR